MKNTNHICIKKRMNLDSQNYIPSMLIPNESNNATNNLINKFNQINNVSVQNQGTSLIDHKQNKKQNKQINNSKDDQLEQINKNIK